jgi:hypothetical protein
MRRLRWHSEQFHDGFSRCQSRGFPGKHRHLRRYTRELTIGRGPATRSDCAIHLVVGPESLLSYTRRIGRVNPRRWSS